MNKELFKQNNGLRTNGLVKLLFSEL